MSADEPPRGQYAVASFKIDDDQHGAAWDAVFSGWLPESGLAPDDHPAFELSPSRAAELPDCNVSICLPVRPL